MTRFLLQYTEVRNKNVLFTPEQSKKIRKVLRMQPGDKVIVFDNKGWEYIVELVKVRNEETIGKIVEQTLHEKTSNITLYQSLPKNLKVEFILQKSTELGVDNIVFWSSEFSQIKSELINKEKLARFRKIAGEAAEQSGRVFVPEISLFTGSTLDLVTSLEVQNLLDNTVVLSPKGKYLSSDSNLKKIGFLVGPEGGFSPTEMKLFEQKELKQIKIGESILRSETAGLAFLSQLNLLSSGQS